MYVIKPMPFLMILGIALQLHTNESTDQCSTAAVLIFPHA